VDKQSLRTRTKYVVTIRLVFLNSTQLLFSLMYVVDDIYTVFYKNDPYLIAHNFGKCLPIFRNFSP